MYMAKEKGVIESKYSSDLEGSERPDGRLRKGRSHREESQLGHWKWGDRALKNLPQGETYSKAKGCFHKWWRYQSILNRVYNLFHLSTKINGTIAMFHALERMNGSKDWIKRLRPGYSCFESHARKLKCIPLTNIFYWQYMRWF